MVIVKDLVSAIMQQCRNRQLRPPPKRGTEMIIRFKLSHHHALIFALRTVGVSGFPLIHLGEFFHEFSQGRAGCYTPHRLDRKFPRPWILKPDAAASSTSSSSMPSARACNVGMDGCFVSPSRSCRPCWWLFFLRFAPRPRRRLASFLSTSG